MNSTSWHQVNNDITYINVSTVWGEELFLITQSHSQKKSCMTKRLVYHNLTPFALQIVSVCISDPVFPLLIHQPFLSISLFSCFSVKWFSRMSCSGEEITMLHNMSTRDLIRDDDPLCHFLFLFFFTVPPTFVHRFSMWGRHLVEDLFLLPSRKKKKMVLVR